jgi:hypothetical protein
MFGKTVQIRVSGLKMQESFTVHKGLLCFYSSYFQAAFNSVFVEGQTDEIDLSEEEDADVFKRFVFWLYRGTFDRDEAWSFEQKIRLWAFGDRRIVPLLQNLVLDEIRSEIVQTATVPTEKLDFLYKSTAPDASLRRFAIDVICRTMSPATMMPSNPKSQWNKQALWDMLNVAWRGWEQGWRMRVNLSEVKAWDMCAYHVHEEGVKCAKR